MLNFHKIKIEYWKVIEGDSFRRAGRAKWRVPRRRKTGVFQEDAAFPPAAAPGGTVKVAGVR